MNKTSNKKGFTFVEVLVSLVILSVGIVAIFKSFLLSLDHMTHLTNRMVVSTILDNDIERIQKNLDLYNILPLDMPENKSVEVGFKNLDLVKQINVKEINGFVNLFEVELIVKWKEGNRNIQLSRSAYLSDFKSKSP